MESAFVLPDKDSPSGVFVRRPATRSIFSSALMNGCFKAFQNKPLRKTWQAVRSVGSFLFQSDLLTNHEPWRSGVSAERRHLEKREKFAAVCRRAATMAGIFAEVSFRVDFTSVCLPA